MAWRRIGDKPLSESMLIRYIDAWGDGLSYATDHSVIYCVHIESQENTKWYMEHEKYTNSSPGNCHQGANPYYDPQSP